MVKTVETIGESGHHVSRPSHIVQTDAGVTRALAHLATTITVDDIEPSAWTMARHCLLDWYGVTVAGAEDPCARIVCADAVEQSGNAQSSVLGPSRTRLHAAQAAFVNGTAAHALDYDDVIYALHGHATAAIAPTVLALAEAREQTIEQALVALIAGIEVAARAATFVGGAHYLAGWHATSTLGGLGAAAGAARIIGLDETQAAHAISLACTQAAGLKSMFGTMAKPLHAGRAARTGVEAALLVERGFETRDDGLECEQGLADVLHGPPRDQRRDTTALGRKAGGFHIQDTLFKYHASCFETHATIEACRALVNTLAPEPSAIDAVTIRVRPANLRICNILNPTTGLQAKFSMRQTAAMALVGIDTGDIESFSDRLCNDAGIASILPRIDVRADDSLIHAQASVTLRRRLTNNGGGVDKHEKFYDAGVAATDLHEQEQRLVQKFDRLVASRIGNPERIKQILLKDDPAKAKVADIYAQDAR